MSLYERTQAEQRIVHAIGKMPYGGLDSIRRASAKVGYADGYGHVPAPVTLDDVAEYLECLSTTIRAISDEHRDRKVELDQVRDDLRGFGRILHAAQELAK